MKKFLFFLFGVVPLTLSSCGIIGPSSTSTSSEQSVSISSSTSKTPSTSSSVSISTSTKPSVSPSISVLPQATITGPTSFYINEIIEFRTNVSNPTWTLDPNYQGHDAREFVTPLASTQYYIRLQGDNPGTFRFTVDAKGYKQGEMICTVLPYKESNISGKSSFKIGETVTFTTNIEEPTWEVNEEVAYPSIISGQSITLVGMQEGTTTLTANGEHYNEASLTINVTSNKIEITGSSSVKTDSTTTLTANTNVSWSIGDTTVLQKVSSTNNSITVKGLKVGSSSVTATADGWVSDSHNINVTGSIDYDYVAANFGNKLAYNPLDTSITSSSMLYQSKASDIKTYYSDVNFSYTGNELICSLEDTLTDGQLKMVYEGKNSAHGHGSQLWANYVLTDRDYTYDSVNKVGSPVTQADITAGENGTWRVENGIYVNVLYRGSYPWNTSNPSAYQVDREHVWPKSHGFNGEDNAYKNYYAGTDMHHLMTGDHVNNSEGHNNDLYGNVLDKSKATPKVDPYTKKVTGYRGTNAAGQTVYEPLDCDKGNIARALFYMATRYHTYVDNDAINQPSPALVINDNDCSTGTVEVTSTKTKPENYGLLTDMLAWNALDPVDEDEVIRNNMVYNLQKNRNPFVDFPGLVNYIFA